MNKVMLLGRLTKEPEIKFSQSNNTMIATFTLAVNRKFVKQGEERQTDFINIVAYSKLAEFTQKYLHKGLQICVSGRIQTRTWNDDNRIKHYVTEIIAEEIDFADSIKKDNSHENETIDSVSDNTQSEITDNTGSIPDDDLPF